MFTKTISLINEDNFKKLNETSILLIGLGGVGGITLEALVRSGIKNITVVDYDTFDITNLNRQILSSYDSIGIKKITVAINRMTKINPNVNIKGLDLKIDSENIDSLIKTDYIIDACDDVNAKLEIYKFAQKNNIKIISSMGMGNRFDLSKISIQRLDKTINDPLAKKIRFLCKQNDINPKIKVVASSELPIISNKISSIFPVVNTAGILLANYIVNDIIEPKK